jgi:hypothetical protein
MILVRALVFVVAGGLVVLLLRLLPMGSTQRKFLLFSGLVSLFLILAFGEHAREAVIVLLVLGMGGLLALDRVGDGGTGNGTR